MNIKRIEDVRPDKSDIVTVKECGNIIEIRYMRSAPVGCPIEKLNADYFVDKRSGEVKEFKHSENRTGDTASVLQSLKRLRDLINANLKNPDNALWVTLTYAENMTDTKRLYNDFNKFWKRFTYYLQKQGYPKAEYITACEPQARGAWHLHCLFLFSEKVPFIKNSDIARIWRHGFTKTKSLKNVDNVGLYLTAYLGDIELTEALSAGITKGRDIREAETTDEQGKRQKKAIIKGARLHLYPTGFNIYRNSRGVKRPEVYKTTEQEAQKIIGNAPQIYEKTIAITGETGEVKNIINYRQYNKAKK